MSATENRAEQVNIATTILTLMILVARVGLSVRRREAHDTAFALVVASVVAVVARIVANTYYLEYGTAAQLLDDVGTPGDRDDTALNLDHLRTGSILVLVARALITLVLWLQVCILLLFYSRITSGIPWVHTTIRLTWFTAAATFVAIELVTFFECTPTSIYWRVSPPPPRRCVLAYGQLFTQCLSNIVLDILLIVIAWPIVALRKRTLAQHVTLYTLFALGFFCTIISVLRIVSVHQTHSSQNVRSLWASVQELIATFVANAPSLYSLLRGSFLARRNPRFGNDVDFRRRRTYIGSSPQVSRGRARGHRPYSFASSGDGGSSFAVRTMDSSVGKGGKKSSWLQMDSHIEYSGTDNEPITPTSSAGMMLKPLPPATTFYDEESAPSPFEHGSDERDPHDQAYSHTHTHNKHAHAREQDDFFGGGMGFAVGQTAPLGPPPPLSPRRSG